MNTVDTYRHGTEGGRLRADTGTAASDAAPRQAAVPPLRILLVDDDRGSRESCGRLLAQDGHSVTPCRRPDEALDLLDRRSFELVLAECELPGAGMELLRGIRAKSPDAVVIVMSAHPSVHSSVAAFELGAWEYLPKPFSASHLQLLVGRAALGVRAPRPSDALGSGEAEPDDEAANDVMVLGSSPAIREAVRLARRVAATDASVFITGESGTGKERLAEFIHRQSGRRDGPLIAINCAAIPESLLETEMFGHRKGAFTGAVEDRQGLLEVADGGTFVLDELIQMPLSTQSKLLRVIQDGVVRRVGSDSVNAVVNVRFIAVTNGSPEEAIRAGRLREDLYYRLRVFPIHLPPLRERREDIPVLADHFLRLFWKRHRGGTALPRLSDEAGQALIEHSWRGNVRELQNVLEHGVVLFEPGMVIRPTDIPLPVHAEEPPDVRAPVDVFLRDDPGDNGFYGCRERLVAQFERRYMEWLMSRTGGNLSKAARIAGVQRTTLYRLMEKHGMQRRITVLASEQAHTSG